MERLRKFLWNTFASHYVEMIKNRVYNEKKEFTKEEQESAQYTLHEILERLIILLYPIIPQVTSVIANELNISLHKKELPKSVKQSKESVKLIEEIMSFNSEVWKQKKDKNISLKESITGIKIPASLKAFESDLRACHNLQ